MPKSAPITSVDRVFSPGKSGKGGKSLEPDTTTGPSSGQPQPAPNEPTPSKKPTPTKKGPGRRALSPEEKLPDGYVERIDKTLKDAANGKGAEWNVGGLPSRPGGDVPVDAPNGISIGQPQQQIPGGDERIWLDPTLLEKEIDSANQSGEELERVADAEREKEERTDSEKSMGGKGKGRGRVRDRIAVERLSQTDWASIFDTRLTEYSEENAKYLPWNRRFVSNPSLGRKIGSKVPERDVLPELNLLIDTSSSLSYKEMAVILGEIENAMESAKITTLNVFLWHHQPYKYKSFEDIGKKNFYQVIDWIQSKWEGGGNDEIALYDFIVKKGKAKYFTISLTDAFLEDHMKEGELRKSWTAALDPGETIFAIIYPNRAITYDSWLALGNRMPGTKVPIFLDNTAKFKK